MSNLSLKSQLRILNKDLASRTEQELSTLVESFQDTAFFKQLDDEARSEVCKALVAEHYFAGDTIFDEGDLGDKFYIVLSGRVEIIARLEQEDQQASKKRTTVVESAIKMLFAPKPSSEEPTPQQRLATSIRKKLLHRPQEESAARPLDAAEQLRQQKRRLFDMFGCDEDQLRTADWMDIFKEGSPRSKADEYLKPLLSPRDKAGRGYDLQPRNIPLMSDASIAFLAMEKQAAETNATRKAVASSPPRRRRLVKLQQPEDLQSSRRVGFKGLLADVEGFDWERASDAEDNDSDADSAIARASQSDPHHDTRGATPPPSLGKTRAVASSSSISSSPRSPSSPRSRPALHKTKNSAKVLTTKVASLLAGASFGETALEGGVTRSATVKCEEACWLAVLHRDDYVRILTGIMEEKRAELLRFTERCPLLSGLSLQERSLLAAFFREVPATQNTVVCRIGQAAAEVYFVVEGEFAVHVGRGATGASSHAQGSYNFREPGSQVVTTALLSTPQAHGLGACLRGEQYHQEALVCRSTKGMVYSLMAKYLLPALPKEQREVLMLATLAQRQFRQNRAAVLLQINERPQKYQESPTEKVPRGVYFPEVRLQAIGLGLAMKKNKKKSNDEEQAVVGECWNPANCQAAALQDKEEDNASEEVLPVERLYTGSRHLDRELLSFWSQGKLQERAQLQRASSEGFLHRLPPPLEVNPFRLRGSIEPPQEPEQFSRGMISSASEPVLQSVEIVAEELEELKSELDEASSKHSNSRQDSFRLAPSPSSRSPSKTFSSREPSKSKYRDDSLARQLDLELAEMDTAATKIQAYVRGRVQRIVIKKMNTAAVVVQARTRGFLLRRKLQAEAAAQMLAEQEQAVTRIQSVFRGLLARRRCALLAKEKLEEMQALPMMSSLPSTRQLCSKKNMVSLEVDGKELCLPEARSFCRSKISPFLQSYNGSRLVTLDLDGPNLDVLKKFLGGRERHRMTRTTSARKLPLPPPKPAANFAASSRERLQSASKAYYSFPMQEKELVKSSTEAEAFPQSRGAALPQLRGAPTRTAPSPSRTLHGKRSSRLVPRPPEGNRTCEGFLRRRSYQEETEYPLDHDDNDQSAAEEEEAGTQQSCAFTDEDKLKLPWLGNGKATLSASGMSQTGALSLWRGATGTLSKHAAAHTCPAKHSDALAMRLPNFKCQTSTHAEAHVDLSTIYSWSRH